jgi:glycosyltransferase involved in cell wall biosynthesis
MTAHLPRSALHLVSASGGGMTRFARDLVGSADGHALLHAAADTWVLETGSGVAVQYTPYQVPTHGKAADWLGALLSRSGCDLLHVHYLHGDTLPLLEAWSARGRPWITSLHDVGFLSADAFASAVELPQIDGAWSARWQRVLTTASAITAPSAFLARAFAAACPGLNAEVVAPGVDLAEVCVRPTRPLRSIAIVGALGTHKGKDRLLQWLAHPAAARVRWTLIGYTEDQLQPGWIADGRLRVHGPFLPERTVDWLRHYDVDLVLFPNRLAESFSYALSDVWAAGIPVLVPDVGALGERVRTHGGGAAMAHPDDAAAVHAQLAQLFEDDGATLARWRAEIGAAREVMVPTKTSMEESMSRIYDRIPAATATPSAASVSVLQPYLRRQLDDTVFRHENIRLARDYAQVRGWASKLEVDVARLDSDLGTLSRLRGELDQRLRERDRAIEDLRARNHCVERDVLALRARNQIVEADAAQLAAQDLEKTAIIAELSTHQQHLSQQFGEQQQRNALLAEICDTQAGELAIMRQRINALELELRPLRIKGARYDRAMAWVPSSLLSMLRGLRDLRRRHQPASAGR